ncbi:hypothetical protein EV361DRAFT_910467 [Lentinula raphanica]|uniref:Uncharacterized protein n=1 Tax=Lentinula raphanica TaxID=153919 RepID=A0AA38UBT5_9AGAR|nr:hypothetical protein F5878DRAFT_662842 [Lentinula raphanica]KAJ3971576.1 hypothetical protein EV361DRAFT_910467 [Lentinula raphanica]
MAMSINGSDSVRKLNFSLATFIDSHISWIGYQHPSSALQPFSITRGVSSTVECDHFTDAITTSYRRCEQPFGEFFFDVFGCLKSVYQISDRFHTKHVAYIGTASDAPFHTYQAAMFDRQVQFLNTLQHVENETGSIEHPLLYASCFFPDHRVNGFLIDSCVFHSPWSPQIKVEIDNETFITSPSMSAMLQSGHLVDRYVLLRCVLYRVDKLLNTFGMNTRAWQIKRTYTLSVSRVDDLDL